MINNTENFYKTEKILRKKYIDPYGFKGLIFESDFETDNIGKNNFKSSYFARRINADKRFDKSCDQHSHFRDETKAKGLRYKAIW